MNRLGFVLVSVIAAVSLLSGCQKPLDSSSPTTFKTPISTSTQISTPVTSMTSPPSSTPTIPLPPGTDIQFERLFYSGSLGGNNQGDAEIKVYATYQASSDAYDWIYSGSRETLLQVDYHQYLVILAFNGHRNNVGSHFEIKRIWPGDNSATQLSNQVYVVAHFDDGSSLGGMPMLSSQYEAVLIPRSFLTQGATYTFNLLSDNGGERRPPAVITL